jgi:hypothetical protein
VAYSSGVNLIRAAALVLLLTPAVSAQNGISVTAGQTTTTITEPSVTDVTKLFRTGDTVALVKVVSGDTEHYDVAVYKAEVVKAFKGTTQGEVLYFGPYVGLRLGWEYVVFLRTTPETLQANGEKAVSYGPVRYQRIFNEGYTALMTSYECVFDGKETNQKCDEAIRICTDYVKTPKSLTVAPPLTKDTPFGCRWTRRKQFIALLEKLASNQ